MKKQILIFPFLCMSLFSCNNTNNENNEEKKDVLPTNDILMPLGAPALPLYQAILDNRVQGVDTQNTKNIPGQLLLDNYNYIVFDSTQAQPKLESEGANAKYEFVRMLTGGNFHLLGFGKTEDDRPSDTDYIIGFNEQAVPGKMFRKVFSERTKAFDENKDGVGAVKTTLETMNADYNLANGQKVDWALVAEPVCTAIKGLLGKKGITGILDINLQTEFSSSVEGWDKPYICQAGLFVNKAYKAAHLDQHNDLLNKISTAINNVFTDLDGVMSTISEKYTTNEAFTGAFGFAAAQVMPAQGTNSSKNGLGIVPNNVTYTVEDIHTFNNLLK